MSNPLQRTAVMTNFIPTSNGQSPPPPPHIINGNELEQNFPVMNVRNFFVFAQTKKTSSFFRSRMMHMI